MSVNTAIQDVQKQDPGSAIVHVFELELGTGSTVYFHTGLESDLTTVQFRDKTTPSTIRTYQALPINVTGFKKSTTGALARPTLSIANVLTTFGPFPLTNLLNK